MAQGQKSVKSMSVQGGLARPRAQAVNVLAESQVLEIASEGISQDSTREGVPCGDEFGRHPSKTNPLHDFPSPLIPAQKSYGHTFPVPSRIHREASRRGGTGAGCEGETQDLTARVRGKWFPSGDTGEAVTRVRTGPPLLLPEGARRACLCGTQPGDGRWCRAHFSRVRLHGDPAHKAGEPRREARRKSRVSIALRQRNRSRG